MLRQAIVSVGKCNVIVTDILLENISTTLRSLSGPLAVQSRLRGMGGVLPRSG